MLKKLFLPFLMLFFILAVSSSTYAIENTNAFKNPTVVFETQEISDLGQIIERAEKGVTDLKLPQEFCTITSSNGSQKRIPVLRNNSTIKNRKIFGWFFEKGLCYNGCY